LDEENLVKSKVSESAVIEGVLIPVCWSASGEVSEIGLMAFDEAEYKVDAAAAKLHGLRDHLRKHVRISGRARGRRVVEVTSVEILDDVPTSSHRNGDKREQ
jgi:hypothetical protein